MTAPDHVGQVPTFSQPSDSGREGDTFPIYDVDLFEPGALRDPFGHYRAIRDLGPVVHLPRVGVLAISRFADVQAALREPEALISGEGIGFNSVVNRQTPERGVLTSDGERHRRLRGVIQKPLSPPALRRHRELLQSLAVGRVRSVLDRGTFDAVPTLARHLPLEAIVELVGLSDGHKGRMLEWAAAFFNIMGPLDPEHPAEGKLRDLELAADVQRFFTQVDPGTLAPGSWSRALFDAVGEGRLDDAEARGALRAFVLPSLDTTIYAMGNLLYKLARSPEQFALLKANPELIQNAVIEGVRHSAVVRAFSRVTTRDYFVDGVRVPAGRRVMVMFGSANRDERRYEDPDRFDIGRRAVDQLGWGTGPHMCVGMHLAKMEMEVMLEALVAEVGAIEADEPTFGTNDGLYGIDQLPMRLSAPAG